MEYVPGRKLGKKRKRGICNTVGVEVEARVDALFNDVCALPCFVKSTSVVLNLSDNR